MKVCFSCNNIKTLNEFGTCSKNKDGKKIYCFECERKRGREYYWESKNMPIPAQKPKVKPGFKYCPSCKEEKSVKEFTKHSSRSDGLRGQCKICTSVASKKWRDEKGGTEVVAQWSRNRRYENMLRIVQYLIDNPCIDCGQDDPLLLEFDHVRGKNFNITNRLGRDWKTISQEISLCEVRCANCHKRKTAERKMSLRIQCVKELKFSSKWQFPK